MSTTARLLLGSALLFAVGAVPARVDASYRERADGPQDSKHKSDTLRLTFGVYQSDKATVMYRQFVPVLEALAARMEPSSGEKVDLELSIYKTYDEGIDALVTGKVDFVRFGPASYIAAKKRNPAIELVAVEEEDGSKIFTGLMVTAAGSDIKAIADLKGRTFAFGDPNSTIGRYLAQSLLVDNGIHARDLKSFKYLDRHDKVAKAVEVGDFDAGSIKIDTYEKMAPGVLRVVARFDSVTKPWVARAGLSDIAMRALQSALLELDDKEALKTLGVSGFASTSDADFQSIREVMAKVEEFEKP
jgi:phosphonate transport system substrate-binding protein